MSHPDPQHDPEHVKIEDHPNAPSAVRWYTITVNQTIEYELQAHSKEDAENIYNDGDIVDQETHSRRVEETKEKK